MFARYLSCLFALLFKLDVHASPAIRRSNHVTSYGAIGDSWASGVTYGLGGYTDYDDNSSGCMRIIHAYGAKLKDMWPIFKGGAPNFSFAACSGAHLIDMFKRNPQMDQLAPDTQFITMQAGGNDAYFYQLARDCIFHNEGKDYGAEYPDASGECSKAIGNTTDYINAEHQDFGLWKHMDDTIRDIIFNHPIGQQANFKMYVLGYAHLWNVDPWDSNWCNNHSFGVSLTEMKNGNRPVLSWSLRSAMNTLTTQLNGQIQDVVRNLNSPKVEYVSITEGFDGYRFCEKDHTMYDEYFGTKIRIHNVSPDGLIKPFSAGYETQEMVDDDWGQAYNATPPDQKQLESFNWVDLLQMEKGVHALSPHQGWSPGSVLRPLHPKEDGHDAIAKILLPLIVRDFSLEDAIAIS